MRYFGQSLSPLEPLVYHSEFALGLTNLLTGQAEKAVVYALKAIEGNRNFAFAHCILALAYAHLDRSAEAAQAVRRLISVSPRFRTSTLRKIRFADTARLQSDLELLREADLPA